VFFQGNQATVEFKFDRYRWGEYTTKNKSGAHTKFFRAFNKIHIALLQRINTQSDWDTLKMGGT